VTAAFDVCGPLPSGVTVLEASAGTGKTYTIAALATRYVAEGRAALEQLLLITFTRMATGELRHRVRERMVATEAALTAILDGTAGSGGGGDEVVALLAAGAPDEVRARRDRLREALANFEAATIDTTHAFCQRMLTSLGLVSDVDRDGRFVEDPRDLVDEVVADFYIRKFGRSHDSPSLKLDAARRIARQVVATPGIEIHPPLSGRDAADVRTKFAGAVRDEVALRRRRVGMLTFDDLLTRLRDTLADDVRGPVACDRLRQRYRVVLVDEFQDTDPVQWEILQRAFVEGDADATLVLIGDPKQAIYAFRGADVHSYLFAARSAAERSTLRTNWRSDEALLHAFDAVFDDAALGDVDIEYRRVEAAAKGDRRLDPVAGAPLRFRVLHREDGLVPMTPRSGELKTPDARALIAALLRSGATIEGQGAVRPGDVAVLVQRNADALLVQEALDAEGVPAVVAGSGSVFGTPAAREWLRLLQALDRPSAETPVRTVALTPFVGWTPAAIATADDEAWEQLHAALHRWAAILRRRGVAAMFEHLARRNRLPSRLLAHERGERVLTDLRHLAQLLHEAALEGQLGLSALIAWLHTRMEETEDEVAPDDRMRRLESDAEAVQVLTVFRSKGLEYPVVYCPFLWSASPLKTDDPPVFHDPDGDDRRTVDVSGDRESPAYALRRAEVRGEELRLAYVALTRAKHQAVVWWAPTGNAAHSGLCRLLFCRDGSGSVPVDGKLPKDAVAVARLEELAGRSGGAIAVERVGVRVVACGGRWRDGGDAGDGSVVSLAVAEFDRTVDATWRRTSYSALTAAAHEAHVPTVGDDRAGGADSEVAVEAEVEDDEQGTTDEPLATSEPATAALDGDGLDRTTEVPLAAMRAGADVGTFVHGVLEHCDFAAPDLVEALRVATAGEAARGAVDLGDEESVRRGLQLAIETPLGPLADGLALRSIGRRDRVDELTFELPLVGGDRPSSSVLTVAAIGALLSEHLADDDPLRPYADLLADPVLHTEIRGYLTGSIDLVLRTPSGRFAVVDYKTNRLAPSTEPLTLWHYRPSAVREAMFRSHYPLQALLYTVALHRYLRWRLADYSAERHLAGILYLFVRGMVGPATPEVAGERCGVFSWRPPIVLVEALSDLFDHGRAVVPS
jgi:exodeoxyribonuclease V beta subunit